MPIRAYLTAIIFSVLFGIIFGLLPARKAAKMDPIVALRNES
jgi:ABC-type antimicrobial peptide transport system permease subunit